MLTDLYAMEMNHSIRSLTSHRRNPFSHYYFLEIVLHNEIQHFEAQQLQLNLSYWRCLFDRFNHLKILNLSLICTDSLLKLVSEHCPCLEYLNATSKEMFVPRMAYNLPSSGDIQVSDDGLIALKSCQRLRELVINEPREIERGNRKQITYASLRFLLRNIPTLEDISYTDIVRVIVDDFDDVESLNLRIIRHHNPTAVKLNKAFRVCKKINQLNLINWEVVSSSDAIEEICRHDYQLKILNFQNICFNNAFDRFFEKFGSTLTSISLCQDLPEIDLDHLIKISDCCPMLEFLMCSVKKTYAIPNTKIKSQNAFRNLKSLHLMGYNIELNKLLPFCTTSTDNLEVISLNELTRTRPFVDHIILKCIQSKSLRQLDLGGLVLTTAGIENVINHFPNLNSLAAYCTGDCRDIMEKVMKSNYDFSMRLFRVDDESSSYDSE